MNTPSTKSFNVVTSAILSCALDFVCWYTLYYEMSETLFRAAVVKLVLSITATSGLEQHNPPEGSKRWILPKLSFS